MQIDWWAPRIDFMWDDESDQLYVNEINTIPWAMQLHLWQSSWLSISEFFDILISNAIFRQQQQHNSSTEFSSQIVDLTVNLKK